MKHTLIILTILTAIAQAETATVVAHGTKNSGYGVYKTSVVPMEDATTTLKVGDASYVVYGINSARAIDKLPLGTTVDVHVEGNKMAVTFPNGKAHKLFIVESRLGGQ